MNVPQASELNANSPPDLLEVRRYAQVVPRSDLKATLVINAYVQ